MSAGYLELYLEQGEDFTINVTLDTLTGDSYDLTNKEFRSDIRKSHWSENVTASFDCSISDINFGIVTMSLNANTTSQMKSGRYVYDLFFKDTEQNTRTKVIEGILYLEPSSTKP